MQHFLLSSSVVKQRVVDPSYSEEKLRIQNIVETLCPRLREGKVILQEIIWSLTPVRCCKIMTHAIAERAVEVTSNISHLLERAEETPQLLDNIIQLEQILRVIHAFVQSETQQNLILQIVFAEDLRVRYFSLDRQLRGLLKLFEQTIKKPLALCGSSTIQEDHAGVDSAVAEFVHPNNSLAIHASGSIFHNANNFVVYDGNFYAAHNLVVKKFQDSDRTPQGIVEGADVYTPGDVPPKQDIYKGRGYRIYSAYSTAKARAVKIKLYEGSRAKDRCLAAARFSQKVMHPNVLHLIGVSPLNSELPFLVFDESTEWAIESIIASALSKGLKQSLLLGLQTVAGISSGLDYLYTRLYPFASVGLDHFLVSYSHQGNIVISFDPEVLADETRERDQLSGASDGGNELYIFHGLCQKTFDAACKAHYEFQKVQRSDLDELNADHDLDQDRFEEIADAGTLDMKGSISDVLSASSISSISSSRRPSRKSNPTVHRRELVWRWHKNETVSLEEIALRFQRFLPTFSTESGFNRRRGRYTTKTAHRCPGYNRIEITLTPDIAQSAIVSHLTPIPHEICPVCKEIVKDAEIFACICGRDDNESIPTIRCSTCSEWHHRPCASISENEYQSFVCQRCKVQTNLKPNKRDSFGHFTKDTGAAHWRYDQTANAPSSTISSNGVDCEPDDAWKDNLRTRIEENFQSMVAYAEDNHATELSKAPDTIKARRRLEADYYETMETIRSAANERYRLELDRERNQRRWMAGLPMNPVWTQYFRQEQQNIMNSFKQSNQTDNSVRSSSESPTEERRSAVPKPNDEPPALAPPEVWKPTISRATGSGATIRPSIIEKIIPEGADDDGPDESDMDEKAIRKDMEMKKREDIQRQPEHQLMLREADSFRREEAKIRLEEEARRKEESKERVRKDEAAKQEARRREEEAIKEKARHEAEMVEKEESRKREEARLKFEREEARKKAVEAIREVDNMKRKADSDETAKRGEKDSRRREEARLEEFRREQEEIRLQNESQHPPAWGSSIKPTATAFSPTASRSSASTSTGKPMTDYAYVTTADWGSSTMGGGLGKHARWTPTSSAGVWMQMPIWGQPNPTAKDKGKGKE